MEFDIKQLLKDSNCRNRNKVREAWASQDKEYHYVYAVEKTPDVEDLLIEIEKIDPKYFKRVNYLINDLWVHPCCDSYKSLDFKNYNYEEYLIPEATHRDKDYEIDEAEVWSKDIFGRNRLLYRYYKNTDIIEVFSILGHGEYTEEESKSYLSEEVNTKLFSESTMSAKEQWLKEHPLPKVLQDYKMPIFLRDNEVSPLTNQQKELMKKAFQYQYREKPILKEKSFPTKQEFESLGIKGTFI